MKRNNDFLWRQDYFRRFADIYAQKILPLTIFTGAGSSRSVGLPDWNELVDRLILQLKRLRETAIGDALIEYKLSEIENLSSNWEKIDHISDILGNQYQYAVRALLKKEGILPGKTSKNLWRLEPRTFLTLNLDGIAGIAYADLRSGIPLHTENGFSVGGRSDTFSSGHHTLVELHGNIDDFKNWVLRQSDLDRLLVSNRYLTYIRGILSQSAVLFYGVGLSDVSVGGHLKYLRDIDLNGGEFFIVCKRNEEILNQIQEIPVQPIFIDDHQWDEGFDIFVETLLDYKPDETSQNPVFGDTASKSKRYISPEELVRLSPNEIRKELQKIDIEHFLFEDKSFDYRKYADFCMSYDSPIYLSTRVNPDTDNNYWGELRVDRELGKGNFGRVYSATSVDGSRCAIKIAHPEVRDSATMLTSFRRGVSSMKILSKDNVQGTVKIIDASELPPSITMQYIEGINLEDYIYQFNTSSAISKLSIVKYICEIVQQCHLHEKIILHRDLRPANIMLGGDYWERVEKEQVWVLDFDLSWFKGATGSEYYMNSTQDLGYLAPEQLDSKSPYTTRSALVDVFGAGMLLYFSIQREHPFANASRTSEWGEKCIQAGRKIYTSFFKSCAWRLSRLIHRATRFNQADRPLMGEMIEEIGAIVGLLENIYPSDAIVIFEEICFLLDSDMPTNLKFNGNSHRFINHSGTEIIIELSGSNTIKCEYRHTVGETIDRRKRKQMLEFAYKRSVEIINSFGVNDNSSSGIGQGYIGVKFSFSVPRSARELLIVKSKLSDISSSTSIS